MKNLFKPVFVLLCAFSLTFASCGDGMENSAENAAEETGEMMNDAANTVENAAEQAGEAMENAAETATENAKEMMTGPEYTSAYICPMHCEGSGSKTPGKCPKCNMDYVASADHDHAHDHGDHAGHNH